MNRNSVNGENQSNNSQVMQENSYSIENAASMTSEELLLSIRDKIQEVMKK